MLIIQYINLQSNVKEQFGYLPYPAAPEHARVHQIWTHQCHLDAVFLWSLDLVAEWLVEADGSELARAVILPLWVKQTSKEMLKKKKQPTNQALVSYSACQSSNTVRYYVV